LVDNEFPDLEGIVFWGSKGDLDMSNNGGVGNRLGKHGNVGEGSIELIEGDKM
jgi:hypothetical protein